MQNNFTVNNRLIGEKAPAFIIAEISGNHGGSLEKALKLIEKAKQIGADAVKLQTYTADTMTLNSDKPIFKDCLKGTLWEGKTLYELYSKAYTPWEWHEKMFNFAKKKLERITCKQCDGMNKL